MNIHFQKNIYIEKGIKCYERRKRCIQFRGTSLNFPKFQTLFFLVCLDLLKLTAIFNFFFETNRMVLYWKW